MKLKYILGGALMVSMTGISASAQGTVDDYNRAYSLRDRFGSANVYYSNVNPEWIGDTHSPVSYTPLPLPTHSLE
ncbi:MAG: hypothetical protein K2K95_12685, partial [Muribaculaceae bacterium]|nr:hypothetical protein [Muribaculaceae bacterium]